MLPPHGGVRWQTGRTTEVGAACSVQELPDESSSQPVLKSLVGPAPGAHQVVVDAGVVVDRDHVCGVVGIKTFRQGIRSDQEGDDLIGSGSPLPLDVLPEGGDVRIRVRRHPHDVVQGRHACHRAGQDGSVDGDDLGALGEGPHRTGFGSFRKALRAIIAHNRLVVGSFEEPWLTTRCREDGGAADSRGLGDGIHRGRGIAACGEQLCRGFEDRAARVRGLSNPDARAVRRPAP
uniref:FunD1 n=1 Tax=Streptosporangium sp. KD35 TaxID=2162663 RepID=A0A2U9KCZ8_9ACTN|nr:FunD1 [Streptosporangium sp. KD35]